MEMVLTTKIWENTDQEKLRIWTLFTQCYPSRPDSGKKEKINSNFYFHTSLWRIKRFYEGLKDVH